MGKRYTFFSNSVGKFLFAVIFVIAVFCSGAGIAHAAVTVTAATGGSTISADTTGGTYTTLTGPTITETTNGAISTGSGTIVINAPSGFSYNTGATVTATITRDAGGAACFTFSSNSATPAASTITYTITAKDGAGTRCHVTFSNIQVRPTAGTPLASGNMTNSGTNAQVPSGAGNNYGTLTEVAGAKNKLAFTTQPSATATTSVDFTTKPVVTVQDQFGNPKGAGDTTSSIVLSPVISSASCGGTAGSGTLTSTPAATGATVTNGVLTYTAMQYSAAESIKICATAAGVTNSTTSNAITVNNPPAPTLTSISPVSTIAGTSAFTLVATGTNFTASSTVNWNGSARTTSFVSASQATSSINASDIVSVGSNSVTVSTPGAGTSTAQIFNVTAMPSSLIVFKAATQTSLNATAASIVFNKPAGVVSGDTMIATIAYRPNTLTITPPAGWVQVVNIANTNTTANAVAAYRLLAGASEPASYTFSFTGTPTGSTGGIQDFSGVDPTNPINATSTSAPAAVNTSFDAPSVTTNVNGAMIITGYAESNADSWNGVFSMIKDIDAASVAVPNTVGEAVTIDHVTQASAGATGINTATISSVNTADVGETFTIALRPGHPVPTTTSISPTSTIAGGTSFTITVNGTGFDASSTVNWNGSSRTTTFVSSTQITATINAADIASVGTFSVTVVNPAPGGGTSGAQTFTVTHGVPTLTSISPTSTTAGGTSFTLTLNGTNFDASSTAQWNGSSRTTTFVSSTQLTATITAGDIASAGTSTVTVFNPTPGGGTSASQNFLVRNPIPTTSSISPTSTTAGGSQFTITINGTNFVSSSTVNWNGSARTTTFVSSTQLTATINAGDITVAGTASVTVVNAAPGGGTSNAQTFTITNPVPTTSSISPTSTTAGGSQFTLTVNGSSFTASSTVYWNGVPLTTTYVSANQITAVVPAIYIATAGTNSVTVVNPTPGGGTSGAQTFTVTHASPTLTLISPTSTNLGGAQFTLTLTGTGFDASSTVNWDGSGRTTTFVSSTQITATILAADITISGTHSVTVVNPTPGGGTSGSQTFTVKHASPTTTSISPTSTAAGGSNFSLTVNGTGFDASSTVQLDGSNRTTVFVSSTQVTATILSGDIASAGTHSITVVNPALGGGTSNSQTLTVTVTHANPTTSSISPTSTTAGGPQFTITINGTGFDASSTIYWNGVPLTTTFGSSTQITAIVPAINIALPGTASVTVVNPTPGGGTSNAQTFTINHASPTTTSISPTSTVAGGSSFTLTVNGTGFDASSTVNWNGSGRTTTFVSSTQITATITSGDIASVGTDSVTVVNPTPGGGTSGAQTFTVKHASPTLTLISPTSTNLGGAQFTLTLTGTGFDASSTVNWDGSGRTTTFVSSTQITATILAADITISGTHSVTVVNPTPGGGTSGSQTFTVKHASPTTTSISPTSTAAGGSNFSLTVNGTGFDASSTVQLDGSNRTTVFVSSTQVTATILSGDIASAGTHSITVVNPALGGGTSNSQTLTVTVTHANPTTSSISPTSTTAGGPQFTITINGTGFDASSTIYWNGVPLTTTFGSSTQITAIVPAINIALPGTASVTVVNPTPGGGTSNAQTFTINHASPTTTSISPTSTVAGGSSFTLTVNGTGFDASSTVNWNGSGRTTTFVSSTQITATITSGDIASVGTDSVTVVNPTPGGGTSGAQTFTVKHASPTLTLISPTSTNLGGAQFTLTLTGTGFDASSTVNWDGSGRTTTFVSSTQITATILAADITISGTHSVTVVNPTPGGGTSGSQTFTVKHASPTTTSISPTSTAAGGSNFSLTVNGTGFDASSTVQLDGSNRTTVFVSSTQVTATILSGDIASAGTHSITVVNPALGGGTSNSQTLTVTVTHANPTTSSISPTSTTAGGPQFTITINGTGFDASSTIYWNGVPLTTTFGSSTQITAIVPAINIALPGTASVTVVNPTPGGGTSNAQTFTINHASPTTTSISPTSTVAGGSSFTLTVNGTGFDASSTVNWNGSGRTTTFVSSTQITATITSGDIASVGTDSVTVVNPTPGGGTSGAQTFTVTSAAATQFALNHPGTMGAGTRAAYVVTRKDGSNNATIFGTNVVYIYTTGATSTSRFYDAPTNGNIITSVTISSGTSTAAFYYYDEVPGTKTVTASDNASAPDGATGIADATDSITVNTGATTQFLLNHPGTVIAGQRAAYVVTREDQVNNLVTSGLDTVYLYTSATSTGQFYNAASGGSLVTSVQITNGTSTATFWYTDTALGSHTVTASDNSSAPDGATGIVDATDSITVTTAPVAKYVVSGPSSAYAKTRAGFTVVRKDAFNNVVTSGTSTVYLYTNSSSSNAKFYNDALAGTVVTSITVPNGQSSASFWYYDDTAGTYTITGSDNASAPDGAAGIQDGTASINILPVAVKFVIIQPANGTVDAPITVTVQAEKPDNSVDTNYQSSVTLNLSGSATTTGAGLVTVTNGVGTINISDKVAETVNLTLADTAATGLDVTSSKQVTFGVGAIAQYTLNHPGSIGAGTRGAYTVTRKDQYGNLATSGASTVYLYSNSSSSNKAFYDASTAGNLITSVSIPDGQSSANFWYYDDTLGSWTITGSDNSSAPDGSTGINDGLDSLTVVPGAVASFTLNHSAPITVGTRAAYTVIRKDAFGNLVTSGSTNVYLYSSSVSTSSAFYLGSSGGSPTTLATINDTFSSANFWYTDGIAGTYTITASDNASAPDGVTGIADATDNLTVSPAPIVATRLVILDPGAATVDSGVTVTVQAQDNGGSLDTTFNGTVTLNTTGSATGAGAVSIVNGVGTKVISDTMAQTVTLSLTDTGSTGLDVSSSRNLVFAPGALAQFSITSPGDMAAGTRQALTVSRKDQFGNGVVSGLTTAYLYSASTNPNKRFYDASSGGSAITSVNFTNGNSSAQVWYYDETAATTTATISDNSTAPDGLTGIADGSTFVHIVPASVSKFILNNPGDMYVSTRLGYTVSRQDAFGNNVSSGITLVYLYSNSTGANKKFYDASTAGNIVTTVAIDDTKTSANFWYYDDAAGTWNVTASDNSSAPDGVTGIADAADSVTVSLVPIVATKLVILQPSTTQIGSPAAVTIEAEDNNGNVQTNYNNSVTLNVTGSATGGGIVNIANGVGVASVNDFTAETVSLSLTDSNSTGLDVTSVQSLTFSATPVLQPGLTGGGTPLNPITPVVVGGVIFTGKAYPGANLSIISLGATAVVLTKSTVASPDGSFRIAFLGISTGARSYGLLVQDKNGGIAQTKIYSLNLLNSSDILEVDNILTSPTVGFARGTITKGDRLTVVGYSTPGSTITFSVDGNPAIETAKAGADGSYKVLLRTGDLTLGSHTIKAKQTDIFNRTSDQSTQRIFSVSNLLVPSVDFNSDGKVNITDASIFLARFNSPDPKVRILDDLNGDGKVDVTDFSIFLRTLRLTP